MVGGMVIEVSEIKNQPNVLFVDCWDNKDTCSILLESNKNSNKIQVGDHIWWKTKVAYWTPQKYRTREKHKNARSGLDYDIEIPRIGNSGIKHPDRERSQYK